ATYADSVLQTYPFVDRIVFYDVSLSNNEEIDYGFSANNLVVYPKGVYQYSTQSKLDSLSTVVDHDKQLPLSLSDDFNNIAVKFVAFIKRKHRTKTWHEDNIFKIDYSVTHGKISYINIPRGDDLKTCK